MSKKETPQLLSSVVVFAVFTALAALLIAYSVEGLGAGFYFFEVWGLLVSARMVAITTGLNS